MTKLFHELIIDEIKRRKKSPSPPYAVLSPACWWKLETRAQPHQSSLPNILTTAPSYCIWCHSFALGLERKFKIKTNCPQKSQIEGGLSCLEARPSRTFLDENVFCFLRDTAFINNFPYLSLILCFQGTISRMLVACDLCWGFRINMQMAHCSGATRGHLGGDQLTLNTESLPGPRIMNFIEFSWCRIFQNIHYFCLFMLQNDCFSFHHTRTAYQFLILQNSWVVHYYSVICKVHYGWHLSWHCNTEQRQQERTSVFLLQAHKQSMSLAEWNGCGKKRALSVRKICQHATIGKSWALDCFCHCDVFSTINWLLSLLEMDFLGNWIHISHLFTKFV